ncbi:MAG: type II toxin-antitoxin system mRNA interferase toxin, RelE/StbE family [Bdellovibrionota bacterium]
MTVVTKVITKVIIARYAEKQLRKLPKYIVQALKSWAEAVELRGIRETRKHSGYHDEPLKGDRFGQRSIRLNRSYRAIYKESIEGLEIIIIEVSKHEY